MGVGLRPSVVIGERGFAALVSAVVARYRTIGPVVRDGSIVLAEIHSPAELVSGVTLEQSPGSCRVVPMPEDDRRRFAWAVGPHSAKNQQHPGERVVFTADLGADGFEVRASDEASPTGTASSTGRPQAIIGLRPCDVAAVGVLDRVLGSDSIGGLDPLVIVVNCTEPGGSCFCTSMDTGPALASERTDDVDLVLWERGTGEAPEYLVTSTSERGERLLDGVAGLDERAAGATDAQWAEDATADAAARMGRVLQTDGLPEALMATLDSSRWDDVASRCLSCGNCTMVCPTCFCSSVHDTSSLDGSTVSRTQRWDSCFTLEHSFIHSGSVRSGTADRYRQWLTHKLSTWWAQFGESGCVGCGRCISWCPVGIDLVEEANALVTEARSTEARTPQASAPQARTTGSQAIAQDPGSHGHGPGGTAGTPSDGAHGAMEQTLMSVTDVLVRRRAAMARDGGNQEPS